MFWHELCVRHFVALRWRLEPVQETVYTKSLTPNGNIYVCMELTR